MRFTFDQLIIGAFIVAVVLMGTLGALSLQDIGKQAETSQWVEHSQIIITRLQTLLTGVEEASTGVRGYILTRDPDYLGDLSNVQKNLSRRIRLLRDLTSDNPHRQADLPSIENLLDQYLAQLNHLVAFLKTTSPESSLIEELNRSNDLLQNIETRVHAVQDDERLILRERIATAQGTAERTASIIQFGSICGIIILLGSTYLLTRETMVRRQVEETLRQNEERVRFMIESVRDYAIIMLDAEGRVRTWNSGAERIKGYRPEEIIGQHFSRFYPEEKIEEGFPNHELREAATRGRFEDEGWRVRKDGSRFMANVIINAVRNPDGDLLGFVKVTRDVTERKLAQDRIKKLNDELAARAAQLETTNKDLEAFTYSVSHDLRAPLRHIHGFVELLQQSPAVQAEPSNQRYMNVIAKAAKNMGLLIDDLLAFSRTGRTQMHPVKLDMRKMIDQVIEELDTETKNRRVSWDIHALTDVSGDPTLLRLVWTNLISNALKYTRPRPEAQVEIGQAQANGNGDEVSFYVRDNGVGFDMEYAGKLFGVFQRLHRAEDFEGTGIGLANVQRIVQRHGGRVWAESKPDAGAVFYFSLPRADAEMETSHA